MAVSPFTAFFSLFSFLFPLSSFLFFSFFFFSFILFFLFLLSFFFLSFLFTFFFFLFVASFIRFPYLLSILIFCSQFSALRTNGKMLLLSFHKLASISVKGQSLCMGVWLSLCSRLFCSLVLIAYDCLFCTVRFTRAHHCAHSLAPELLLGNVNAVCECCEYCECCKCCLWMLSDFHFSGCSEP